MILGVCKNLCVTPDYVLHEMTYLNVVMYSNATPSYDYETDKQNDNDPKSKFRPELDANNPDNFNDLPDEELITTIH